MTWALSGRAGSLGGGLFPLRAHPHGLHLPLCLPRPQAVGSSHYARTTGTRGLVGSSSRPYRPDRVACTGGSPLCLGWEHVNPQSWQ